MYAIELARLADLFDDPLVAPLPPTLHGALSARVADVASEMLDVLRVVSAVGQAGLGIIAQATSLPGAHDVVDGAIDRGLLSVGDDLRIRMAHPMLASVVLAAMSPLDRQALHRRLAGLTDDPDARARHLALSCSEPDSAVAEELERAAHRIARRGASALAAELAAHSARVTPGSDLVGRLRRTAASILHRAAAGDKTRALDECERLLALMPPGPARAEAITLRVAIDFAGGDVFLAQALAEAGDDDLLRGRIIELRGWMATTYRAELDRGEQLSAEALAIAEQTGDPTLEMLAASALGTTLLLRGRPRPELMERALRIAARHPGPRLGRWPQGIHGRLCFWCGHLAQARELLEALQQSFKHSGLEFQRPYRLMDLAELELAAGNIDMAADIADEGIEAAMDAGNAQAAAWLGYPAGIAHAHRGETHRVRHAIAYLRAGAGETEGRTRTVMADHVLGLEALIHGEPAEALAAMAPGLRVLREVGLRLPSVIPILPDAIEAAALCGEASWCQGLSAELGEHAAAVRQPWVDVAATRGRGLAALAVGDDASAELLGTAAAGFDRLGYRMDATRALLLQARALRRMGRRNASADILDEVVERFTAAGAAAWLPQATGELDRVAPGRHVAELTPTESRIAQLVVAGRRNREIAGELFISVATVEAHLTRMYRKLHVRSRTELTGVLQG
jgi:DNA-binding NarL/FixJ family response regulator